MTDLADHNVYDQVPYPSLSFTQTHPDRLATLATLLGMKPAPVEHCRVLELGCASGGNLIPMAYGLPESEFVGIDLTARQIVDGQATVSKLGLNNIFLKHLNILDVGEDLGQFDYIIAHGVYTWVPPAVQNKILDICKQNLAPNGVAYISYNTYPGWHMLNAIRDMMRYHTRQITEPQARTVEARAFVDFLAKSVSTEGTPHSSFLNAYVNFYQHEIKRSRLKSDALLTHDELAEINSPIYFHQFAEQAADYGLQYLADANFQAMLVDNLPSDVSETLRQIAQNTIELEQYMDFLRNRTFRETLLCHQSIRLNGSPRPECLTDFYVASPALPMSPGVKHRDDVDRSRSKDVGHGRSEDVDIHAKTTTRFYGPDGAIFSTDHPITKAAMLCLAEAWPQVVHFRTLLDMARARSNGTSDAADDAQVLGASLLQAYGYSESLVELHVYAPSFVVEVSECPVASPSARLQAQNNAVITNMRHERVHLDKMSYHLLPYLDGNRDHDRLVDILEKWAVNGVIQVQQEDEPIENVKLSRNVLAEMLDSQLGRLASAALLIR